MLERSPRAFSAERVDSGEGSSRHKSNGPSTFAIAARLGSSWSRGLRVDGLLPAPRFENDSRQEAAMPESESATNPARSRARAPRQNLVEFSANAASSSREGRAGGVGNGAAWGDRWLT